MQYKKQNRKSTAVQRKTSAAATVHNAAAITDQRPQTAVQRLQVAAMQPALDGAGLVQLQKWRYVSNRNGQRFEPYGPWHTTDINRPKRAEVSVSGRPDRTLREGNARPVKKLKNNDIFDDVTGEVTTAQENKQAQSLKRKLGQAKRQQEINWKLGLQSGAGFKSKRQQEKAEKKLVEKKAKLNPDEDTGIYHLGGDSPGHGYDFEDEGLHSAVNNRIALLHQEQVNAINEDNADAIPWLSIPDTIRQEIESYRQKAEKDRSIIHHSGEERPRFTSSILEYGTNFRPSLKEDTVHTGIGRVHDDLSHSIPFAQVSDQKRIFEEGGVNHPKNIPYENKVTNQVVNVAIEKVGQQYLDQKKAITKVVMRIWDVDHIARSIHVYFVEDYKYPLVFGTRDLGSKIPLRWDK